MEMEPESKQTVAVREAKILVWGPIYVTLNLEKTPTASQPSETVSAQVQTETLVTEDPKPEAKPEVKPEEAPELKQAKKSVNILSPAQTQTAVQAPVPPAQNDNTKKITYIYNLIDHGLDCECIDVKGELLIRSALPVYRKITQGIEFEQITTNQIKLIITSRVLDNYQEVFQGFTTPKATFRIWVLGYKFK